MNHLVDNTTIICSASIHYQKQYGRIGREQPCARGSPWGNTTESGLTFVCSSIVPWQCFANECPTTSFWSPPPLLIYLFCPNQLSSNTGLSQWAEMLGHVRESSIVRCELCRGWGAENAWPQAAWKIPQQAVHQNPLIWAKTHEVLKEKSRTFEISNAYWIQHWSCVLNSSFVARFEIMLTSF